MTTLAGRGAVLYVDSGCTNPVPPYAAWVTAATNVQDAVDAAAAGDEVIVTNGVYVSSGRAGFGGMPFGVVVNQVLLLRSVNGPQFTFLNGGGTNSGVCLANGALLSGFTLTNGPGWGVYCQATGGGCSSCTLNNCTLTGNSDGADGRKLNNCIVYFNIGVDYYPTAELNNCCVPTMPPNGTGNITNAPLFVDQAGGNFRLQPNSPCINAGKNSCAAGTTDLDGNPRIAGATVDIGAYEFQNPASILSYAWLQRYGLPTDGSADYQDPDGDGMNNWQEWLCGTDPLDPHSVLRMLGPSRSGAHLVASWQSVAGVTYLLERSTNLSVPNSFATLATNLAGQAGMTSFTDTNAPAKGPIFYRVGVGH